MPTRPITPADLWTIPRVGDPVPSPDGRRVLVPVRTHDRKTDAGTTRLWVVPASARGAGDGAPRDPARPLTTADASSGSAVWSPDGARVAFLRKPAGGGAEHGDVPQLHVMPVDGGEPERLTDLPLGAADPHWFPDGRRIAFLSPVYREAPTPAQAAVRKKALAEANVKAHVTESRFFRFWDHWLTDEAYYHVFVLDLDTRVLVDLTPGVWRPMGIMDPTGVIAIAPDGDEIALTAFRGGPSFRKLVSAVYTVRVPKRLTADVKPPRAVDLTRAHPADAFEPAYSPDGRFLVYGIQREVDFYADKVRLVAYDRTKRTHRTLTEDWPLSATAWRFGDRAKTLYVLAEVDAKTAIYALDLPAAVRSPRKTPPTELVRGGTWGAPRIAGGRIFASRSTLTEPPEAFSMDPSGKGVRRLTAFTQPFVEELELGRVQNVTFKGAEDDRVQMFVVYPPGDPVPARGEKPKRRRPLVHMIHGGPHGVFGDSWHWRWNAQAFAAPGYAVAIVNFHGSTSWGQDFAASILGRWGDQPYEDVMKATDWLVERGVADPKRMAATGGSYGGYLVSWIAGHTDRFACLVNHAGVCDFQTQYASDVTHGRARSMGGEPWENLEGMDRYNPMRHASGFRSPMLVLHGEKDYRVPSDQGLAIYGVYRAKGLPARLVVYPDENHWILKPGNSEHWYGEVLGWMKRWLKARR